MAFPHHRLSHAQNREDLVLAGLLKTLETGFYVDVGANHPEHDSVTLLFYERGWSGINIEPNPDLHQLLARLRPRDINLDCGLSSAPGVMRLRCYDQLHGLSSFSRESQAAMAGDRPTATYRDLQCRVDTLAAVLARHRLDGPVHFLKIDVEGLELEVLLGNDWQRFRPWVLCIERTLDAARRAAIAALLSAHRYQAVFDDGINDFWVADEHLDLWHGFSYAGDIVLGGVAVRPEFVPEPLPIDALLRLEGRQFVEHAYRSVLRRDADTAGLEHYLSALMEHGDKRAILRALVSSDEARERGIDVHLPPPALGDSMLAVPAAVRTRLRRWLGR